MCIVQSVCIELQVLKTKLVIRQTGQYKGALDCAQRLWRKEQLKGFYRGFVPNILGIMPYAGIDLAVYEVSSFTVLFFLGKKGSNKILIAVFIKFSPFSKIIKFAQV